ncbi:SIR2 family protein [Bacillus shivajii]|uniref:SIR2 family protein n=1 Tax=Bacillus shivajii TaxID=1983719 RepID=UPI001CFC057D|nr:SIR2 family protein [Bacillus shivajii]UCZ53726.1 SIR2 family protein [Bacillus shivajii]
MKLNYQQQTYHQTTHLNAWLTTLSHSATVMLNIERKDVSHDATYGEIKIDVNDIHFSSLIKEWEEYGARLRYLDEKIWRDLGNIKLIARDFNSFSFSTQGSIQDYELEEEDIQSLDVLLNENSIRKFEKTVVVFGAGASFKYMPDGNQLLYAMLKEKSPRDELIQFISEAFGSDIDRAKSFPSFSQVLNFIEIALDREENFSSHITLSRLRKFKAELINDMRQFMNKLNNGDPESQDYDQLIYNLKPIIESNNEISFINLNYDMFFDQSLKNQYSPDKIDYILNFDQEGEEADRQKIDLGSNRLQVIKLHGSLDWMICPTCFRPRRFDKLVESYTNTDCKYDHSKLQEFLFPPMQEKHQVHSHWLTLQTKADALLREADRVIFIGYSLSDDDLLFRFKLQKHLYRDKPEQRVTIQVVDKEGEMGMMSNWVSKRYQEYFGPIDFRPIGFTNFAKVPF